MYLFISDIHLGSPFFKLKDELINLLTSDRYSKIYIIGDIIDEWETDIESITEEYSDVIDCVNNSPKFVTIIRGNHDPDPMVLQTIFPNKPIYTQFITELHDKKFIMLHGHEFDYRIMDFITWSKLLFPLQWGIERLGFNLNKFLRNLYHSIAQKIGHKNYNDLVMAVEYDAVDKYKDYDVIIMGHTHKHKLVRLNNERFYINTGSLINYPVYIEFDEIGGEFTLRTFEGVDYAKCVI